MKKEHKEQHRKGTRAARAAEERAKKRKRFLYIILIVLVILGIIATPKFVDMLKSNDDNVAVEAEEPHDEPEPVPEPEPVVSSLEEGVDVSYMPNSVRGYSIIGEISIEKIGISQFIKSIPDPDHPNDPLKEGVILFWPTSGLNKISTNACLAGHDFTNIFGKLDQLNVGDEIKVTSKDGVRVTYEVTDKVAHVQPNDMSYIEQKEDGIRRITLITCDQGGLTRLIIKASQKA